MKALAEECLESDGRTEAHGGERRFTLMSGRINSDVLRRRDRNFVLR